MDLFDTRKKAFAAMVAADLQSQKELLEQENIAVIFAVDSFPYVRLVCLSEKPLHEQEQNFDSIRKEIAPYEHRYPNEYRVSQMKHDCHKIMKKILDYANAELGGEYRAFVHFMRFTGIPSDSQTYTVSDSSGNSSRYTVSSGTGGYEHMFGVLCRKKYYDIFKKDILPTRTACSEWHYKQEKKRSKGFW